MGRARLLRAITSESLNVLFVEKEGEEHLTRGENASAGDCTAGGDTRKLPLAATFFGVAS